MEPTANTNIGCCIGNGDDGCRLSIQPLNNDSINILNQVNGNDNVISALPISLKFHNGNGVGNTTSSNSNAVNSLNQHSERRDSAHIWTPLLSSSNSNGNVTIDSNVVEIANNTLSRNNNEWKESEDMNNLKNGFLHHPKHHQQGNNNNTNSPLLLNGMAMTMVGSDKYDPEQDPLTGLHKPKQKKKHSAHKNESDESDFDSETTGGGCSSNSGAAVTGHNSGNSNYNTTNGCGLFACRPRWARRFASTKCFMVVFLLAYILQGMYMTYFVSVITTIEKLFQIKSKTTGFLLSASEMGQISTAMLLTYFAGRGHRPRWIACGMVLFSIAAFSCALPHFIFGKQLMQSAALLKPSSTTADIIDTTHDPHQLFHTSYTKTEDSSMLEIDAPSLNRLPLSAIDANLCQITNNSTSRSQECNEGRKLEQASHSKITVIVLCIFFVSLLCSGIGQTAVATLGIPYIDDNVASKQSPMYMAITIGVRILGPASGFIVGSFCTRWYVNFSRPGFDASDPRWIGAWWLGPVVIGTLMISASIAMFSFPSHLRGKIKSTEKNADVNGPSCATIVDEKPKLKDFPKTVRRQLSNDILMFRTASCVFHLLPIAGLYTFLPKYLETQFRLTTYDANMVAAFCGILVMGVGIVISGLVILKLKPSARSVSAWIAFTALFYSAGMFILMFIGCSMNDFAGFNAGSHQAPAVIKPPCDAVLNCTCDMENFAPICGVDGRIYISSCHAGCTSAEIRNSDNRTIFSNCACISDVITEPAAAVSGYCDSKCKNFIIFILIFAICVFMHSTSEVGSMLLVMRCTHPKDKAMAMGVIQSAIGLFGNVPCPIIYGAVVDSACLIWKTVCGKHGACSLYNADTFRHYFLGITSGIMFLAFIMDIVVWSKAHRIDIALEDNNEQTINGNDESKMSTVVERKISVADTKDTNV